MQPALLTEVPEPHQNDQAPTSRTIAMPSTEELEKEVAALQMAVAAARAVDASAGGDAL